MISLGGAKDSSMLLGHEYTYAGSRPGRVFDAVCSSGVDNCVLVFDELDKISSTDAGREVASVLMSIIDPAQNKAFEDSYLLGVPLDLSRIICVFTFNDISRVDPVLLDRMHVVRVKELSFDEKKKVVQSCMLPAITKSLGLENVTIEDDCVTLLLQKLPGGGCGGGYMREAEKALERAIISANIRTIRTSNRPVDHLQIKSEDLPNHTETCEAFTIMYT